MSQTDNADESRLTKQEERKHRHLNDIEDAFDIPAGELDIDGDDAPGVYRDDYDPFPGRDETPDCCPECGSDRISTLDLTIHDCVLTPNGPVADDTRPAGQPTLEHICGDCDTVLYRHVVIDILYT